MFNANGNLSKTSESISIERGLEDFKVIWQWKVRPHRHVTPIVQTENEKQKDKFSCSSGLLETTSLLTACSAQSLGLVVVRPSERRPPWSSRTAGAGPVFVHPVVISQRVMLFPTGRQRRTRTVTFVAGALGRPPCTSPARYSGSRRIRWLRRSGVGSRSGSGIPREPDRAGCQPSDEQTSRGW